MDPPRRQQEITQDARVGISIQTDLEARHAIAVRNSSNSQSQSNTDPESQNLTPRSSPNDEFVHHLGSLSNRIATIERHLDSTKTQSHRLDPSRTAVLLTIQTILKGDPSSDISPLIPHFGIETWPLRSLIRAYYTRIELKEAHRRLKEIGDVINGNDEMEEESEGGNGFLGWVERGSEGLTERGDKLGQVRALLKRIADCDTSICWLLLDEYGVECWVLEIVLDVVARMMGVSWRGGDNRAEVGEGNDRGDGRAGGHQIGFPTGGRQVGISGGNVHVRTGGGGRTIGDDDKYTAEDLEEDGPEEWEL